MNGIKQIFQKEMARIFRDKKNGVLGIYSAGGDYDWNFDGHRNISETDVVKYRRAYPGCLCGK